jgi:hypothetical protein
MHLTDSMKFYRTHRHFWTTFVHEYWEKEPVLVSSGRSIHLPRIEPHELFCAVVSCVEDFCRGGAQKVRLYVDGGEVDILGGEHRPILPSTHDASFEGYNSRMAHAGFSDYALVVADWHQFDRSIWERIVVSIEGLAELVGITQARMDTQMFLGTYRVTPFGVHLDSTSAFHFPLIGTKIMRFWQGGFGANTPALQHSHNYESYLQDSVVIRARPGEAIYWPSEYWHVGESDGVFSVTWGLGYWFGNGVRRRAARMATELFEAMESKTPTLQPDTAALVALNHSPADDLIGDLIGIASSERLRRVIVESWLRHYSAYGFLRVPPLIETVPVCAGDVVRKKPPFRIFASQIAPGLICVASAGHCRIFPLNPVIGPLIEHLNEGVPLSMMEIIGNGKESALAELITFCIQSGAVLIDGLSPYC